MRMAQALTATPVEDDWQAVHSTARVRRLGVRRLRVPPTGTRHGRGRQTPACLLPRTRALPAKPPCTAHPACALPPCLPSLPVAVQVDVGACKHSSSGGGGGCAPAHVGVLDVMDGSGSVMELDPQPWEPDSSSATCR